MKPSERILLVVIAVILIILALILNSLGIYLLIQIKKRSTHQNLILMNLSAAEILLSITALVDYILWILDWKEFHISIDYISYVIECGVGLSHYLIAVILTLDRLAMCTLTVRYKIVLSHKRTTVILACCWIIGLCFSLLIYFRPIVGIARLLEVALDVAFLLIVTGTYTTILCLILKKRRELQQDVGENTENENRANSSKQPFLFKFYFTSALIILSFAVFVTIPSMIRIFHNDLVAIMYAVQILNYIADPCIYIFFQKTARNLLKRKYKIKN